MKMNTGTILYFSEDPTFLTSLTPTLNYFAGCNHKPRKHPSQGAQGNLDDSVTTHETLIRYYVGHMMIQNILCQVTELKNSQLAETLQNTSLIF